MRIVSKASLDYVRPIAQRDKLRLIRILAPNLKAHHSMGFFVAYRKVRRRMDNSGIAVQKLNSKTEIELEELHNILQSQAHQITELRSRLGIVLCDRKQGAVCGEAPAEPHLNSPLVDKLKELKASASQNIIDIGSIIDSLEV